MCDIKIHLTVHCLKANLHKRTKRYLVASAYIVWKWGSIINIILDTTVSKTSTNNKYNTRQRYSICLTIM